MKKLLTILLILIATLLSVFSICYGQVIQLTKPIADVVFTKDTTMTGRVTFATGTIVKFGSSGHIHGPCTIYGGIIQAYQRQWIIDTNVIWYPEAMYDGVWSAMFYGAGRVADNSVPFQMSANLVLGSSTIKNFFIPGGTYNHTRPIYLFNIYNGQYTAANIHVYGESGMMYGRTILNYTGTTLGAICVQMLKSSEIDHLWSYGLFRAPVLSDPDYYNLSLSNFHDASGRVNDSYSGLIIDYDSSKNIGGSSDVYVHDCYFGGYAIDYNVSPNGVTQNADILTFERIRCGESEIGFASSQPQEKDNIINNIVSWERVNTLIVINHGGRGAGDYHIDHGNVAGYPIKLVDITAGGYFSTHISNLFCESLGSIGNITSGSQLSAVPMDISKCNFNFKSATVIGSKTLLTTINTFTKLSSCDLRYYGEYTQMNFSGPAQYDNTNFDGTIYNPLIKGSIYNNCRKAISTLTPL